MSSDAKRLADFVPFTFNFSDGTLRRSNVPVELHRRAAEILGYFIDNAGRWISKDELRQNFWDGVTVADNSIDRHISEIRRALGDSATNPRFIETKYLAGWRFIASVTERTEIEPEQPLPYGRGSESAFEASKPQSTTEMLKQADDERRSRVSVPVLEPSQEVDKEPLKNRDALRTSARATTLLAIAFILIVAPLALWLLSKPQPRIINSVQLTNDGKPKIGPLLTDGQRIFFVEYIGGEGKVFRIPISGGEPAPLNVALPNVTLQDVSRDGSTLLLRSYEPNGGGLWTYSLFDRALRPVQTDSTYAAWACDGRTLAAADAGRSVIEILSRNSEKRIAVPGYAADLRWSPDSKKLRFSLVDRKEQSSAEWEVTEANLRPQRLSSVSKGQKYVFGGEWSRDGKYFFYWAGTQWHQDLWVSREKNGLLPFDKGPWRLTNGGPGSWEWPTPASDASTIFALNISRRPELVRFDAKADSWQPYWGGAAAYELDYSRDLKWVAYTHFRDHTIWKARPDGSERTRLTEPGIEAHQPHWSPDGTSIAFMGKNAKGQWRVYQIAARGGHAEELLPEGQDQGVPTWSPDGRFLFFGDLLGRGPRADMSIHALELSTRKLTDVAGSKGLWSPRWSPDGRYIAATTSDYRAIRIAPRRGAPWRELVRMKFADNATWSPDSRYIYFNGLDEVNHPWFFRLTIPDGELERVADLADFTTGAENWYGVGPGEVPLALRAVAMEEIYALQCVFP